MWLRTVVNRETKKFVIFFVGDRSSKNFKKLCENISHIEAKFYAKDKFPAYNIIPQNKHLIGKSHTFTVERQVMLKDVYEGGRSAFRYDFQPQPLGMVAEPPSSYGRKE